MHHASSRPTSERLGGAAAAAGVVGLGALALIMGLSGGFAGTSLSEKLPSIVTTTLLPKPPPPREKPARAHSTAATGRPSPANRHNKAAQVFAAPTPILVPPPPFIAVARPGTGNASQNGASDKHGPGQGAGGVGDGLGGGGNGDGDGAWDEAVTRPRQIRGRLRYSDLPPDLQSTHQGGELELTYRVGIDGRVSECRVVHSSGRPELDARTCALITERFRFKPSLDAQGRPVPSYIIEKHGWFSQPDANDGVDADE